MISGVQGYSQISSYGLGFPIQVFQNAAFQNNLHLFEDLLVLAQEKDIMAVTSDSQYSILHLAVQGGNIEIIRSLLNREPALFKELVKKTDVYGQTALHWAAGKGHEDTCEILIEEMQDNATSLLMQTYDNQYTVLHLAVHSGNSSIVKMLCEDLPTSISQELVNKQDRFNQTPLHWAVTAGNKEVCELLTPKMTDESFLSCTRENEYNLLHLAVHSRNNELMRLLTEKLPTGVVGVMAITADRFGQIPLHWAAAGGNKQACELLITPSIGNIFAVTKEEEYTILHMAVHSGNNETIAYLTTTLDESTIKELAAKPDIHGQTPLHCAASKGNKFGCELLCSKMDPEVVGTRMKGRDQTALHFATQAGSNEVVELLLEKLKDFPLIINWRDHQGCAALAWAKTRGIKSELIERMEAAEEACRSVPNSEGQA